MDLSFIQKHPFFSFFSEKELSFFVQKIEKKEVEVNTILFESSQEILDHFFLIESGEVDLIQPIQSLQKIVQKYQPGDYFGLDNLLSQEIYSFDAIVVKHSTIYQIPFEDFLSVLKENRAALFFLVNEFAQKQIPISTNNTPLSQKSLVSSLSETDALQIPSRKKIVSCQPEHTIWQAAKTMNVFNVSSILVIDPAGLPLGIVTDSDFRRKILAQEESLKNLPIKEIMSSPVKTVKPNLTVSEVMLLLSSLKLKHLCVTEDGTLNTKAIGVISQSDIVVAQGNSPALLARQILRINDYQELKQSVDTIHLLVQNYLQKEISINFITNISTELYDLIFRKILKIVEKNLEELGYQKPTEYEWLFLGKMGRREYLLDGHLKTGILYGDLPESEVDKAQTYFLKLSHQVHKMIADVELGVEDEHLTASNPIWCQSLSEWKQYLQTWLKQGGNDKLSLVFNLLDIRTSQDKASNLIIHFRDFIQAEIKENPKFLNTLVKYATKSQTPTNFMGKISTERQGKFKNQFDLENRALNPLAQSSKVLALIYQIPANLSIVETLQELARRDENIAGISKAAAMAYEQLLRFRALHSKDETMTGGFVNLYKLNKLEIQNLRNIFKTIEKLQQTLIIQVKNYTTKK